MKRFSIAILLLISACTARKETYECIPGGIGAIRKTEVTEYSVNTVKASDSYDIVSSEEASCE